MTPSGNSSLRRKICASGIAWACALAQLNALTDASLLGDPKVTPKEFAAHFEKFEFEYGVEVQPAEKFLARRRGDCDDYAVLAGQVLNRNGYEARIIHVRLVGQVAHAVCYVTQSKAYLDYNNRKYALNLQRSGRTLREIAGKVAESVEANWTTASEFTYDYHEGLKHFGMTVVKTEPPSRDPDSTAGTPHGTPPNL